MALTHARSTNNYGVAKFIVATSAANGTHTTLAGAMADASAGDTIFLRNSVTENVTITPGVNISAWSGTSLNTPSITGTLTMTGAGTSTISGLTLITNSAAIIAVTGSAASVLVLNNCYLNCSNNSGITYSSSSSSSAIAMNNCQGDLGTTGINFITMSSAGNLTGNNSLLTNSGGSTTASTFSAGFATFINCRLITQFTSSGSTNVLSFQGCILNGLGSNLITIGSTAANAGNAICCNINATTGVAVTVNSGSNWSIFQCNVGSSNANAINGSGNIVIGDINFSSTSSVINSGLTVSINSSGPINVPNIGIGAAPGTTAGLTFDGTSYMNNYAEGTFTPTVDGAVSGTTTYTTQVGLYTRIGRLVICQGTITITAATGTGNATFSGFPFTIQNLTNYQPMGTITISGAGWSWPALTSNISMRATKGTTNAVAVCCGNGVAQSSLQMTNAAVTFFYTLTYMV